MSSESTSSTRYVCTSSTRYVFVGEQVCHDSMQYDNTRQATKNGYGREAKCMLGLVQGSWDFVTKLLNKVTILYVQLHRTPIQVLRT